MRKDRGNAFTTAEVVTAKVRWLKNLSEDGAEGEATTKWIHCTPLMHHTVSQSLLRVWDVGEGPRSCEVGVES